MEYDELNFGGRDLMTIIVSYKVVGDDILVSTDDGDIVKMDKSWLDIVKEIYDKKLSFNLSQKCRINKNWGSHLP